MISFARESLIRNRAELEPIFLQHWCSVTPDFHDATLHFDWDSYAEFERTGKVHLMIIRDDGDIVGYQLCLASTHLHSKDFQTAQTAFFYVLPEYRDRMIPSRLFRETEKSLKELGIQHLYVGCKADKDLAPLFVRLGYHQVEALYAKVLA